jgi:hypothetical protein
MYTKTIGCNGCFGIIIFFLFLFIFLKLWIFIALLFLVLLLINLLPFVKNALALFFQKKTEFKAKYGTVYKQCEYCGTKVDRNAKICPMCRKSFE